MKQELVIVKKPMFKKQYQIERHYIDNAGDVYKKDVYTWLQFITFADACNALKELEAAR